MRKTFNEKILDSFNFENQSFDQVKLSYILNIVINNAIQSTEKGYSEDIKKLANMVLNKFEND